MYICICAFAQRGLSVVLAIYCMQYYMCYHSYIQDHLYDSLRELVDRLGGWTEPCLLGMYIFVPRGSELLVVIFDPSLIRRSNLDCCL